LLEAAAGEAGLTKPGLMYHFRTRDDLLIAIQRHLTEMWEEQLLAELGKPLEQERAAAYARVNAHGPASKADLAFMVESATSSRSWQSPPLRSSALAAAALAPRAMELAEPARSPARHSRPGLAVSRSWTRSSSRTSR
jgi:AcrR family transcriptional regulator